MGEPMTYVEIDAPKGGFVGRGVSLAPDAM